jgi:hypothetical protein
MNPMIGEAHLVAVNLTARMSIGPVSVGYYWPTRSPSSSKIE